MTTSQSNLPPPADAWASDRTRKLRAFAVPLMLFLSSMLMAIAWLGHLKFKGAPFLLALAAAWLIVLPEYMLNVAAVRLGKGIYSGATMARLNLCWGVGCVVFVSLLILGEEMSVRQSVGFGLMFVAMFLIGSNDHSDHLPEIDPMPDEAEQ